MKARSFSGAILALAASLVVAACGSSREDGFAPPASPPPTFTDDGGIFETPDADTACVSAQQKAEPVPLAMIVLIDRSGSMSGEKWASATKAIRAFADRAEVIGMKMGLQFFPPMGTTSTECDPNLYKRLAVPIATLPENVIPLQQRLTTVKADGGGTPMGAGLEGSIGAMRDFIANDPMHQGVVILVTDGDPTNCGSVSNVASIAASAVKPLDGVPSIRTFTIGMQGASFASLDRIAQSGGSTKSFNVGAGVAAQQALLEALEEIRAGVVSCEYTLPLPPPGEGTLDLEKVSLEFVPGKNDPTVTIRKVESAETCGATTGGFYYDDPRAPTKVVLCPATCAQVRGGAVEAKVDLVFGCIRTTK
jgi:uncharacterized protein YegL